MDVSFLEAKEDQIAMDELETTDFKHPREVIELVNNFENCSLRPDDLDQRSLLAIGFWYLFFMPRREAEAAMELSIMRYRFHYGFSAPRSDDWVSVWFDALDNMVVRFRNNCSFLELANIVVNFARQDDRAKTEISNMRRTTTERSFTAVACCGAVVLALFLTTSSFSQAAGGVFTLVKTSTAGGGGRLEGGEFSVSSTIGQPASGKRPNGGNAAGENGFWTTQNFAPTAASVMVRGRVVTNDGRGITNAMVTLTDPSGMTRTTRTSAFGYYSFSEVLVGEAYILDVRSKRFSFVSPQGLINVDEEMNDVDFIAAAQ